MVYTVLTAMEADTMSYTVKQLADLAGVSVRTLHYYDQIDLLAPSWIGDNGYRHYEDEALYRLQQILLYRELGLSLDTIQTIIERPDFDRLTALQQHRARVAVKIERLYHLLETIDHTILDLTGAVPMSKKKLFEGFTPEEEEKYAEEARDLYGAEEVNASYKLWNSYSPQKQQAIKEEGAAIYQELADQIGKQDPASAAVQAIIKHWHEHMRYFYEPSVDRLRGLGQMYVASPDFANNFREIHPELPEFARDAITVYCDGLEAGK